MTKHNLENPACPDCGTISHKHGFLVNRDGKIHRFKCIECGRSFNENTQFVKLEDMPQHLSDTT